MSFEQYLQEAAGNLAGLPSKWIKVMQHAGENSEIERSGVKVKSWSALTGAIRKALPDGEPGCAIFIDGIPTYLIIATTSFSGSRQMYHALTGDGARLTQRASRMVPDHAAQAHARAQGYRSNAKKLYYYDIPDHNKSEIVDKVSAGIREALGIAWDEKSANTEFEIRRIKVDKKRLALAAERRANRPESRMSGSLSATDTGLEARRKVIINKLEKSADMKKLVDVYNAFNKTSLTTAEFVRQAASGKNFSVDEKIIHEYTSAARNMSQIASKIKSMTDPAGWRVQDRRAFVGDMKSFGYQLADLKEAFEDDEEMLALLEEIGEE